MKGRLSGRNRLSKGDSIIKKRIFKNNKDSYGLFYHSDPKYNAFVILQSREIQETLALTFLLTYFHFDFFL